MKGEDNQQVNRCCVEQNFKFIIYLLNKDWMQATYIYHLLWFNRRKREFLPVASIENEDIIEIGDVGPVICRNIDIYPVYSF